MSESILVTSVTSKDRFWRRIHRCQIEGVFATRTPLSMIVKSKGLLKTKPNQSCDWIALAMLMPAMKLGRSLQIEGKVSPLLLHFLREDVQALLRNFDPKLSFVDIHAEVASDMPLPATPMRVGTGFSAGIDSFATLTSFKDTGTSSALVITDLLTFNVGAFGEKSISSDKAYKSASERLVEFADDTKVHHHAVDSNLAPFYQEVGLDFERSHTMRNAAAASLFADIIDIYLYSSGYSYDQLSLQNADTMANIDAILLPMLNPRKMRMFSAKAGSNRVEKTKSVANEPLAQQMLDVCVASAHVRATAIANRKNCSRCWKCCRTMITLDALGKLDDFGKVFDLDHYRANRNALVASVKARADAGSELDKEAFAFFQASRP